MANKQHARAAQVRLLGNLLRSPQANPCVRQPNQEWKIEQGMSAAGMPLRDETMSRYSQSIPSHDVHQPASGITGAETEDKDEEDPNTIFAEEYPGWHGYVEWQKYPRKRAKAEAILARNVFPPPPEFQLSPIPDSNPVLEGVRWKMVKRLSLQQCFGSDSCVSSGTRLLGAR